MKLSRCASLFALPLGLLIAAQPCQAQGSVSGTILGSVFDGATGNPIPQVAVEILPSGEKLLTDTSGKFRVEVPPGKYQVKLSAANYLAAMLDEVVVVAGAATEASTVMVTSNTVTKIDVVETVNAVAATAESVVQERRLAATVSDAISGEEIRKSTASHAAAALEKVTGVSIVGEGYVYVRGLGERYSATMLNNAMLPTTEPEKRVVPLDLFPAALIDNIRILKSYTPDLPGEFSGGLVQMSTVEFPVKPTLSVSLSYGVNSRTTNQPFDTFPGGGRDFFGFDTGARDLPPLIPEGRLFPGRFTPQQFQQFGRAFANNWEPVRIDSMRPQQSYTVAGGNTWGRFGLVGALTFSNRPQFQSEFQQYLTAAGGRPVLWTTYDRFEANNESARIGGVLNAAFKINAANKLIFRNTLTRDTDKEARTFSGFNGGTDTDILNYRLRWIERSLVSTSAEGEHVATRLGNSILRWQLTYSASVRNEPDLRETVYGILPGGALRFLASPQSGLRFFNNLNDQIYEPQGDYIKPFFKGSVSGVFKMGFRGTFRRRDFAGRRFRFVPVRPQTLNLSLPPNRLFAPENIRPDGFEVRENTRGTDTYMANMDVYAGYGMVDLALTPKWRLVAGVRLEDANIRVETIDPLVPGAVPQISSLVNRDPLVGANLIYSLSRRQNLRFAYGQSLSRPDFRELSPFEFTNVVGGYSVSGNPDLLRAKIDNFDARWEWFLGGDQLLAASFFVKRFDDPIEVTLQPTTGDLRESFINADSAQNYGIELEARKNLGFVKPFLRQWIVHGNFTFVNSSVEIGEGPSQALLTSRSRPMMGQSRYIYNIITEWARPQWRSNARFYANSVSRRITDVGAVGLPDVYQERNVFMDFIYQYDLVESGRWSIKFSAENLLDNIYRWTQSDVLVRRFQLGRTYSIGTTFSIF